MRNALFMSATAVLAVIGTTATAGVRYVAADDSKESSVCVSAATDRHNIFSDKVEAAGFGYKMVAAKLNCNGVNIALFSAEAGNTKTAQRLARYSPARGEVEIRQAMLQQPNDTKLAASNDIIVLVKGE